VRLIHPSNSLVIKLESHQAEKPVWSVTKVPYPVNHKKRDWRGDERGTAILNRHPGESTVAA